MAIGRVEGDERYLFGMIAGALVLRDGRIAVLDDVSALIRVYSPEGEHLEDWGGHGEGPGEFSSAESIFPYRGDSILVTEFVASRFTILDDQGRYGRNMIPDKMWESLESGILEAGEPSESCCRFWGPLHNGAFLISYPEMMPTQGTGTKRGSVTAAIISEADGAVETVGVFAGGTYQLGLQGSRERFQFQPWFNMVAGLDGYFATEGDSYSINAYDASGHLRRIIRLVREPRPVTDEIKAAYEKELRDEVMASAGSGGGHGQSPEELIRRLLSGPYPSHLPTFSQLIVDPEGNIWARQVELGTGDEGQVFNLSDFFVFGAGGRYLGVVELPPNLHVFQVGMDFVLAKVTDDLEVEYVHLYGIEK